MGRRRGILAATTSNQLGLGQYDLCSAPQAVKFLVENFGEEIASQTPEISLKDNELEAFPQSLAMFHSLKSLDLSHNKLTVLPGSLLCQTLPTLVSLAVTDNYISQWGGVKELANLRKLESLDIRNNPLPSVAQRIVVLDILIMSQQKLFEQKELEAAEAARDQRAEQRGQGIADDRDLATQPERGYGTETSDPKCADKKLQRRKFVQRRKQKEGSPTESKGKVAHRTLSSEAPGVLSYFGVEVDATNPVEVSKMLSHELKQPAFFCNLDEDPVPRKGPFPMLQRLNGMGITVEDMDLARNESADRRRQFDLLQIAGVDEYGRVRKKRGTVEFKRENVKYDRQTLTAQQMIKLGKRRKRPNSLALLEAISLEKSNCAEAKKEQDLVRRVKDILHYGNIEGKFKDDPELQKVLSKLVKRDEAVNISDILALPDDDIRELLDELSGTLLGNIPRKLNEGEEADREADKPEDDEDELGVELSSTYQESQLELMRTIRLMEQSGAPPVWKMEFSDFVKRMPTYDGVKIPSSQSRRDKKETYKRMANYRMLGLTHGEVTEKARFRKTMNALKAEMDAELHGGAGEASVLGDTEKPAIDPADAIRSEHEDRKRKNVALLKHEKGKSEGQTQKKDPAMSVWNSRFQNMPIGDIDLNMKKLSLQNEIDFPKHVPNDYASQSEGLVHSIIRRDQKMWQEESLKQEHSSHVKRIQKIKESPVSTYDVGKADFQRQEYLRYLGKAEKIGKKIARLKEEKAPRVKVEAKKEKKLSLPAELSRRKTFATAMGISLDETQKEEPSLSRVKDLRLLPPDEMAKNMNLPYSLHELLLKSSHITRTAEKEMASLNESTMEFMKGEMEYDEIRHDEMYKLTQFMHNRYAKEYSKEITIGDEKIVYSENA